MKKLFSLLLSATLLAAISCNDDDDESPLPPPPPPPPSGGTVDVRGTISTSQTWEKTKTYRLRGYVYVTSGAVLTIQPGTKIISNRDSAGVLLIYKGAKIMADGTAAEPIVFTSAESTPAPGDFGGLVLVGLASGNGNHKQLEGGFDAAYSSFGGSKDDDNSGVLRYVRIEYGGKAVNPGDEVNGLSLYTVGSGTTIDYVEVVRGLDDAFEFFGGTVNCKHLIAYHNADDDFDMDDGYRGKIQFAISVKDPTFTDAKGTSGDISNNFEVDNVSSSSGLPYSQTPITSPTLSNFTAVGPNNTTNQDFGYGMRWRRGSRFVLANSIVMGGQKAGLSLEDSLTVQYYKDGGSKFYNSFIHALTNTFQVRNFTGVMDSVALRTITTTTNYSMNFLNPADIKLTDPFNTNNATNVKPQSGSPALTTPTKFDVGSLSDAFFEKVNYIGAMDATTDWTTGWTAWK